MGREGVFFFFGGGQIYNHHTPLTCAMALRVWGAMTVAEPSRRDSSCGATNAHSCCCVVLCCVDFCCVCVFVCSVCECVLFRGGGGSVLVVVRTGGTD